MKNLRKKFMNANALKLVLSMGAAVFALTLSSYRNRLVPVTYFNTSTSSTSTSTNAADYQYKPTNSCGELQPTRNCSFTTMEVSAPAVDSHPTQAQVDAAAAANDIQKGNRIQ